MKQSVDKKLCNILQAVVRLPVEFNVTINDLTLDSRSVQPGNLFIAVNGEKYNAADYIDDAIQAGAAAIIWEAAIDDVIPFAWSTGDKRIPVIAITSLKNKISKIAQSFYNNPSEKLDIVAVTGTNGKTSCVNFIAQALQGKITCGLIGTLGIGIYPDISVGMHTTPDIVSMHKALASFASHYAAVSAIEVSSHALAQNRIENIKINTAIFTNLTQDHLDYHGSMQSYFEEKAKLFQLPLLETSIINIDDPYGEEILKLTTASNVMTYSVNPENKQAAVFASNIQVQDNYTFFTINTENDSFEIKTTLTGNFNISNLLAVTCYLLTQNFSGKQLVTMLQSIKPVTGRMQRIEAEGFPLAVVDYAHTPDALEKSLSALAKMCVKELTCVFGCGGERDVDKRQLMGQIAEHYADRIFLTNDNPRGEAADEIISNILSGIQDKSRVVVELDREVAIKNAINSTHRDGCVLIAGKGHENYQLFEDKKTYFSDVDVVKNHMSLQE